ncbi:MAG: permease [Fusobacteriota bacterium]
MNKRKMNFLIFGIFVLLIVVSYFINFELGVNMGRNFFIFAKDMVLILPPAFILIGLFDVWASHDAIEKSFGHTSGIKKYFYAIALAATTVGGTFVAFPVANSLYHKGAGYDSIITYVTAASLFMIPMSLMEASILGPKFTLLRLGLSVPLILITANILKYYLNKIDYKLPKVE